jgi:hypothetical protein
MQKMIPIKTTPGMGEGRIKESDGGGEFKYDIFDTLIYCQNFCKCHNVPPPSTTIKKECVIIIQLYVSVIH